MNRGSRPSRPTTNSSGRLQSSLTNGVPAPLWTVDFRNPDAALGLWNDSVVSLVRGSSATYINDLGQVATAPPDVLRQEYSPTSKQVLGILLEQAGSNSQPWSEAFTLGTNWTQASIARNSTTALSPAGTNTALQVTATSTNASITGLSQSSARVVSIYLRRVSGTGAIQITSDATGTSASWVTVPVDSVWKRFELPPRNIARLAIRITTLGDSIELWGAQNELSTTSASAYIPTGASSVTRQQDLAAASFTNPALWGGLVTERGCLYVELLKRSQRTGSPGLSTLVSLENVPDSTAIGMFASGFALTVPTNQLANSGVEVGIAGEFNSGGFNVPTHANIRMKPDQTFRSAISWDRRRLTQATDGNPAVSVESSGSLMDQWTELSMAIAGSMPGAGGVYVRCSFWPEPLNADQLRAVTA